MRRVVALVALSILLALPAAAQDFRMGLEAYGRGDYATALREFRPLAEQGDAGAQTLLGGMYLNGKGVPRDHGQALDWFRRAAGQGNVNAQNNLGAMYRDGDAVPVDPVAAYLWFDLAAQRGFQPAAKNRDAIRVGMSEAQLVQAQRLAREWKPN